MRHMHWIVGIILAIVFGFVGGFWGAVVGFGVGVGAFFAVRREIRKLTGYVAPEKTPEEQEIPLPSESAPPPPLPRTRRRKIKRGKPLEWIGPSQPVQVGGYRIPRGMVYVTNGELRYPGEPSAIDPSLPTRPPGRRGAADLGYYSDYSYLEPDQRGAYLEWLASGCRDDDPAERDLGFVFIYFYGLERRILYDGDEDPRLFREVLELLNHYGPATKSRSLKNYLLELLHFAGYRLSSDEYRTLWPDLLVAHGAKLDGEPAKTVLANLVDREESMHWTVGCHLAPMLDASRRSVVVKRSGSKFWALFQKKFEEVYPEGMQLRSSKRDTWFNYRPASASLINLSGDHRDLFRRKVANVMGIHSQFKHLSRIWNECIDELSGYSRAIARSAAKSDESAVKAFNSLPSELRKAEDHPLAAEWDNLLSACGRVTRTRPELVLVWAC